MIGPYGTVPGVSILRDEACDIPGASVERATGGELDDPGIAPILSFPAALVRGIGLGPGAGVDVDAPASASACSRTSRDPAEAEEATR